MATDTLSILINKAQNYARDNEIDSWLILQGKKLNPPSDIKENSCGCGCNMKAWVRGSKDNEDKWIFHGDSDTLHHKGLTKIILDSYTGLTTDEIASQNFHSFKPIASLLAFEEQRGMQCIINQIQKIAK